MSVLERWTCTKFGSAALEFLVKLGCCDDYTNKVLPMNCDGVILRALMLTASPILIIKRLQKMAPD